MAHPTGQRLLVFAPHQDDEIIGCGGVFLKSLRAGREIQVIYVTDGASPKLTGEDRRRYVARRHEEAQKIWMSMGGNAPMFWDLPGRQLPLNEATATRLAEAISDFRPDCLFIPFFLEDPHDHRKLSHLLWMAYQQHQLPEHEVWAYQVTSMICPNVAVDITEVESEKHRLMQMWVSQNQSFDYAHRARGLNAANALYVDGVLKGVARPYVELFFVEPMASYQEVIGHYFEGANAADIYG